MKRRVMLIGPSLRMGGAERVLSVLANTWADRNWSVHLVTLAGRDSDHFSLHSDIERHALGLMGQSPGLWSALGSNLRRVLALRRTVRIVAPDIVISFVDRVNVTVLVALAFSGVPIIVSERTDPRKYDPGRFWRALRKLTYPRAKAVVVQTTSVASWVRFAMPAWQVETIPNPVRALRNSSRDNVRPIILAAGRFGWEKGFDVLMRAFSESRAIAMGYRLVLLGDGPERPQLHALAASLGVDAWIDLPGVVDSPEDWMETAAIFALPSRFEGFPNSLIEAMAMGCAVVAADCDSGPREIVIDGENGLLVAAEDVHALARALDRLLSDERLRVRLGTSAKSVREKYSLKSVSDYWEELIAKHVN